MTGSQTRYEQLLTILCHNDYRLTPQPYRAFQSASKPASWCISIKLILITARVAKKLGMNMKKYIPWASLSLQELIKKTAE
jgi:hypothetical protein